MPTTKQLDYLCQSCGKKLLSFSENAGKKQFRVSSWYPGKCDCCKEETIITQSRDFGYPVLPKGGRKTVLEKGIAGQVLYYTTIEETGTWSKEDAAKLAKLLLQSLTGEQVIQRFKNTFGLDLFDYYSGNMLDGRALLEKLGHDTHTDVLIPLVETIRGTHGEEAAELIKFLLGLKRPKYAQLIQPQQNKGKAIQESNSQR